MSNIFQFAICTLLLLCHSAWSTWDFAVTIKSKIVFYDDLWHELTSSAHQFTDVTAITFDETEEVVYFNDNMHNNGSIFALKIPFEGDHHVIEKIVQRTDQEEIKSLAFDPLQRNLYWSDQTKRAIFYTSIDASSSSGSSKLVEPKVFINLTKEFQKPDGIALDICRRKLYWTNSNFSSPSIESCSLDDGCETRENLISTKLYLPHGIVIDQLTDRIYFAVDQEGMHFSIESAELDGSDRHILVKDMNQVPLNLAVTKNEIIWTDRTSSGIWSLPKSLNIVDKTEDYDLSNPKKMFSFREQPEGIITRSRFLTKWQNDTHCSSIVNQIKTRLLSPKARKEDKSQDIVNGRKPLICLNEGELVPQTNICICQMGYKGAYCETSECHNYCVHGTCSMSSNGFPKCTCQNGFYGERCQSANCTGYCLNDGVCKIEKNQELSCECLHNFGGDRCERNSTEICSLFCRILKHDPDTYVPFGCHDICEELADSTENGRSIYAIPVYKHLEVCRSTTPMTSTVIIVMVAGVVSSCACVLFIIQGVRRFYKPARPRIKKTFVVRKQKSASPDTPLTNRPIATEQCEITIENCCNMNICDTPCFDPKLVEQTLSCDSNTKEDKKMLIHNMEDDLY